jgi:hypothetical protein
LLVFDLAASLEAIEQFEQAMEVGEAFLECCLRLHLDWFVVAFGHAGAAALLLNMVDAGLHQTVSSVVGGCYESSCDTLPQPLMLAACRRIVVIQCPMEAIRHLVEDAYNLNVAFVGLHELLYLRVFTWYPLFSYF